MEGEVSMTLSMKSICIRGNEHHWIKFLFLFLLFISRPVLGADFSFRAYWLNRSAIAHLTKNDLSAAQTEFLRALDVSPFSSVLHLNLGVTYQVLGQADKAEASYKTALKFASDDFERYLAYFNLGFLSQQANLTDQSLAYYQMALQYNPQSIEVKTNIELMMQSQDGQNDKNKNDDKKNDEKKDGKGQGGGGQGQDKDDQKNKDQNKDQNQDKDKDGKDKDEKDKKDQDGQKDQPQKYQKPSKPQPKPFKSDKLDQGDVKKILGEIGQQEQKIRAEFNRKEVKEKPRDKDW